MSFHETKSWRNIILIVPSPVQGIQVSQPHNILSDCSLTVYWSATHKMLLIHQTKHMRNLTSMQPNLKLHNATCNKNAVIRLLLMRIQKSKFLRLFHLEHFHAANAEDKEWSGDNLAFMCTSKMEIRAIWGPFLSRSSFFSCRREKSPRLLQQQVKE